MNRLRGSAVLLLALAAITFAGCGGSGGTSAGDYVKAVCQAVGPFKQDVQARAGAFNVSSITNPVSGKNALTGFLSAVAGDADTALSKLKSAGTPGVSNGKQIATALTNAFTQVRDALNQASKQARSLSTGDTTSFKTQATQIGSTVQGTLGGIGSSLGNLKSPDLEQAAAKEPACKSLGQ